MYMELMVRVSCVHESLHLKIGLKARQLTNASWCVFITEAIYQGSLLTFHIRLVHTFIMKNYQGSCLLALHIRLVHMFIT